MKREFSRQTLEKLFKYKFSRKFFRWEPSIPSRQKERHTDMTKRIFNFRNFANAPNNASPLKKTG